MKSDLKKHPIKLNDPQAKPPGWLVQIAVLLLSLCVCLYIGLFFVINVKC